MPTEETVDEAPAVRHYEDLGCWVVWGADLARAALQDQRLSSETLEAANLGFLPADIHADCTDLIETTRRWFALLDGARHREARRAVQPVFSPRQIRRLEGAIRAIAEQTLEEFARSGGGDAIPGLANRLSARVIADILGFPDCDDAQLHTWAQALAAFFASSYRRECAIEAQRALREMGEFIRTAPDTGNGIWATAIGDDWDRLATSSMLLFGGLETTASLVGTALWHMLGNGLQHDVSTATGGEVRAIVERALEFCAPLGHVARLAADDLELGGCPIPKGDLVLVSLSGRDHLFGEPGNPLDPPSPGGRVDHVAFGFGTHYCMGAPLARVAAAEVLTLFAHRFPEATVREVSWRTNRTYRGLAHLLVDLGGAHP